MLLWLLSLVLLSFSKLQVSLSYMLEVPLSSVAFACPTFHIMPLSLLLTSAFVLLFSHSAVNIAAVFVPPALTFAVSILSSAVVHLFPILFFIFTSVLTLMTIYFYEKLHSQSFL